MDPGPQDHGAATPGGPEQGPGGQELLRSMGKQTLQKMLEPNAGVIDYQTKNQEFRLNIACGRTSP